MNNQQYLYVLTIGHITGKAHEIEIWYVEHEDGYYIVSEKWEKSHWVQNIHANPQVKVRIGQQTFEGIGSIPQDESIIAAVKAKMDAKYQWSDGLVVQLCPKR